VNLRELLKKIELKLRPLQLGGGGQRELDEVDGLAGTSAAQTVEEQNEDRPL
jgi:hypothetical protein